MPIKRFVAFLICFFAIPSAMALATSQYRITPYEDPIDAVSASTALLHTDDDSSSDAENYPRITGLWQTEDVLAGDGDIEITFTASEPGVLTVEIFRFEVNQVIQTSTRDIPQGDSTFNVRDLAGELYLFDEDYAFILSMKNAQGISSMQHYVYVEVNSKTTELVDFDRLTAALYQNYDIRISPPYSEIDDGTYWSMNPGELDDDYIWHILTQPITVYDDGRMSPISHVYMRANPDGTGARVAQIHGLSQGLHVIGEVNEHGYVLVEAFSNYDPDYQPLTPEEQDYAFHIRQGYLLAKHLKTIEVQQDYAFLIDKYTQRMYMFKNGQRVTEFLISTGKITNGKYYYETIAGEFITIGHGSGYWSGDLYSDLPIRFNGGTMLHEVPFTVTAGGYRNYSIYEGKLGQKHSSGCVRLPYWTNEEGYNQYWLFKNLTNGAPYKIIIWDDLNRNDSPKVWR